MRSRIADAEAPILLLAVLLAACGKHQVAANAAAAPDLEPSVAVATAARRDLAGTITLTAEFDPFRKWT